MISEEVVVKAREDVKGCLLATYINMCSVSLTP